MNSVTDLRLDLAWQQAWLSQFGSVAVLCWRVCLTPTWCVCALDGGLIVRAMHWHVSLWWLLVDTCLHSEAGWRGTVQCAEPALPLACC